MPLVEGVSRSLYIVKHSIVSELVVWLPDFEKLFKVHTGALDREIEGVLVKEGHPEAFESRKLSRRVAAGHL